MTTREYLEDLKERGVHVDLDGDDLRITAPKRVLTESVRDTLRRRKGEIVDVLRSGDGSRRRPPPLETDPDSGPAPLSFAQEQMWFLHRMDPESTAYNRPYAFHVRGPLDVDALRGAVRQVLERHQALRTHFRRDGEEPVQEVRPVPDEVVRVVEMDGASPDANEVRALIREEARSPFDLEEGPLARFLLIRLGARDHVFVHHIHHAVSDGWSTRVLHDELEALYAARMERRECDLAPPPVQYPDFARWQRAWLSGSTLDRKLEYWREKLGGDLPVLELPLDHPRPPVQSYRGGRARDQISGPVARAARVLAREEKSTVFMVLFAAHAALLHRYSGQDDIPVGTPTAGRRHSKLEGLIGLFINSIVLRTDLSGDPSFRELVRRVRATSLEAMEHEDVPFEKVVEALRPERSVSHHPLFQALFTYLDKSDGDLSLEDLDVQRMDVAKGSTYMDLDLTVVEQDGADGLDVSLRYNADLFEDETGSRLLRHYRNLLEGAVEAPDTPLSELPVMDDAELHTILERWNDTRADFGPARTVHRVVDEQAQRTPDRVAVVSGSDELTYAELVERAEALAGELRERGVRPGALVGVSTERTPGMLVAVLAVLKAGGAYLPVDPSLPAERIRFMLDDARAPVVVADDRGLAALPEVDAVRVRIDRDGRFRGVAGEGDGGAGGAGGSPVAPAGPPPGGNGATPSTNGVPPGRNGSAPAAGGGAPGAGPDDLAYTIYTSGSTGRPKGVELTHRTVHNFIHGMARTPGIDEDDVVLAVTTLSFDIHVLELFVPLSVGARVVLADSRTAADGRALLRTIREREITLLQATPATWRLLLEAGWDAETPLRVLSGGEALPPDLARSLTERSGEVWNLYGPTETTVWSARYRLPPDGEPVLIGRPIENTRIYILDRSGNPVPVGAPGELFIGGAGVARGYRDRPELNAERFLQDPFPDEEGARMYRTGDRARWRPDGTLEFLGRMDHQVKLRGFRIELGEIEAVLAELDEVEEAVTAVREDRVDDKRLVAYVVFRPGRSLTASEIRRELLRTLPDYMVPALVVELEELPLTPNGKVDRNALPDPLSRGTGGGEEFEEPRSEAERMVAEVWKDLLGVDRVGRRDNFFDLGGHSLLSMRAVHRIEERSGRTLNPRVMILNTLEQIAAEVETA